MSGNTGGSRPVITVMAVSSVKWEETCYAVEKTSRELPVRHDKAVWDVGRSGEKIKSRRQYSHEILRLGEVVKTPWVLIVQHDGYALDRRNWSDEFLEYDYVGAPWPFWFHRAGFRSLVGNGGFSLRSQKWLKAQLAALEWWHGQAEDEFMCVEMEQLVLDQGLKVAPLEVALRFSQEHRLPEYPFWADRQSFGMHGRFEWSGRKLA